jgi:hypothetical protein
LLFFSIAVSGAGLALAPAGCRSATQITLEIGLSKRALCTETSGTAITVGVDAAVTEKRVGDGYVNATTDACNENTKAIGTLVLTPTDAGHASVVVIVAYGGASTPSCKPPLYKGCVVARRQVTFTSHAGLHMPITIDPNCKDVPCDAFSTCRSGACFSSSAACDGDVCTEPGATEDGGTNPDAAIIPDTGVDGPIDTKDGGEGGTDAGQDATDGSDGSGDAEPNLRCESGILHCTGATLCSAGNVSCCASMGAPVCVSMGTFCTIQTKPQYCCTNPNCGGPGDVCNGATATTPGTCGPGVVTCKVGVLQCPASLGSMPTACGASMSDACCDRAGDGPICTNAPPCQVGEERFCCSDDDCGTQGSCVKADPANPNAPRTCTGSGFPLR